jgi:predicted ATPase
LPAQLTPFIGREREIAEVRRLLSETRLLTLTGPGGTGKTRLALRIAENVAGGFRDGVYFVGLAKITDPKLVAKSIADALDATENASESLSETLKRVIGQREILLLIDNFEHVLSAAPFVSDLLAGTSKLKALTTSREPLKLYGEYEFAVPPMTLPDPQQQSLDELNRAEAIALFAQRARAAKSSFNRQRPL